MRTMLATTAHSTDTCVRADAAVNQDFDSPALKTKKHYLSFTTSVFVPAKVCTRLAVHVVGCFGSAGWAALPTLLERDVGLLVLPRATMRLCLRVWIGCYCPTPSWAGPNRAED